MRERKRDRGRLSRPHITTLFCLDSSSRRPFPLFLANTALPWTLSLRLVIDRSYHPNLDVTSSYLIFHDVISALDLGSDRDYRLNVVVDDDIDILCLVINL